MEEYISELLEQFKISISNDESEKDELVKFFEKYLLTIIYIIKNSESKYIKKDIDSIKQKLQSETERIIHLDINAKKRLLIEDKNFQEIRSISYKAFELAERKLRGKEVAEKTELSVETLISLLENVKEYNKKIAEKLVSEGILDIEYIEKEKPKIMSLRLFHLKRMMEKSEKYNKEI